MQVQLPGAAYGRATSAVLRRSLCHLSKGVQQSRECYRALLSTVAKVHRFAFPDLVRTLAPKETAPPRPRLVLRQTYTGKPRTSALRGHLAMRNQPKPWRRRRVPWSRRTQASPGRLASVSGPSLIVSPIRRVLGDSSDRRYWVGHGSCPSTDRKAFQLFASMAFRRYLSRCSSVVC